MVYVDDAKIPFYRMKMCHMLADTLEELHSMADKIGVDRKWFQGDDIPHYDVALNKRAMAIENGAKPIDSATLAFIISRFREGQKTTAPAPAPEQSAPVAEGKQ